MTKTISKTDPFAHLRMLTAREVSELTRYTVTHIYRLERAGNFPRRLRLGSNRVGWKAIDIEAWFASRPVIDPPDDGDE